MFVRQIVGDIINFLNASIRTSITPYYSSCDVLDLALRNTPGLGNINVNLRKIIFKNISRFLFFIIYFGCALRITTFKITGKSIKLLNLILHWAIILHTVAPPRIGMCIDHDRFLHYLFLSKSIFNLPHFFLSFSRFHHSSFSHPTLSLNQPVRM